MFVKKGGKKSPGAKLRGKSKTPMKVKKSGIPKLNKVMVQNVINSEVNESTNIVEDKEVKHDEEMKSPQFVIDKEPSKSNEENVEINVTASKNADENAPQPQGEDNVKEDELKKDESANAGNQSKNYKLNKRFLRNIKRKEKVANYPCLKCGVIGHTYYDCSVDTKGKLPFATCRYCSKFGHSTRDCQIRVAHKPNAKIVKETNAKPGKVCKDNLSKEEYQKLLWQTYEKEKAANFPCHKCGVTGHKFFNCTVDTNGTLPFATCRYCFEIGHGLEECPMKLEKMQEKNTQQNQGRPISATPVRKQNVGTFKNANKRKLVDMKNKKGKNAQWKNIQNSKKDDKFTWQSEEYKQQVKDGIIKPFKKVQLVRERKIKMNPYCQKKRYVAEIAQRHIPQINAQEKDEAKSILSCNKCGSSEHLEKNCQIDTKGSYPFAKCFICYQVGHKAVRCPNNTKGVFPLGGQCFKCGSTEHRYSKCSQYEYKPSKADDVGKPSTVKNELPNEQSTVSEVQITEKIAEN